MVDVRGLGRRACNIAHSPQRCSVLVGPDLRAGRFLACTVTLLGRLGDRPLPHSLARMRSLNTHEMAADVRIPASAYPGDLTPSQALVQKKRLTSAALSAFRADGTRFQYPGFRFASPWA